MITQKQLKSKLSYSPIVGVFEWRRSGHGVRIGGLAGGVCAQSGYIIIGVLGKNYRAHQLAWLYMTGTWPDMDIDHKDGDRSNNAFGNLRLATKKENQWNRKISPLSTTGEKGVSFDKRSGKYRAQLSSGVKRFTVGWYDTVEEAAVAIRERRAEIHGEFTNHGLHRFEIEELEDTAL